MKPAAPDRRQHDQISEGAVAGEQIEQAEEQQRLGKDRIEAGGGERKPDQVQRPEQRIEQSGQHRAADEEYEAEEAQHARRANKMKRPSGVHQKRLHVALDPARALAQPLTGAAARLLVSRRIDDADPVSLLSDADTQIGVFGDVEGVPGVQFAQYVDAKMIRRAAQWDRNAKPFQTGQYLVKPQRIVEREHAGEPVFANIVVVEATLQAGGVQRRAAESRHDFTELVGFRSILGVIDHEIFAARKAQREIASLRLGLWLRPRHENDLEYTFKPERARGLDGFGIVGLEHDLDVELAERVIELAQRLRQARQHGGFAEHRHQNREHWQILGLQGARFERDCLVDLGRAAAAD